MYRESVLAVSDIINSLRTTSGYENLKVIDHVRRPYDYLRALLATGNSASQNIFCAFVYCEQINNPNKEEDGEIINYDCVISIEVYKSFSDSETYDGSSESGFVELLKLIAQSFDINLNSTDGVVTINSFDEIIDIDLVSIQETLAHYAKINLITQQLNQ